MTQHSDSSEGSLLDKLDSLVPVRQFDAFPKVPRTYTSRTSFGGIATIGVILLSFLLSLNDLGEFLWGWPDYEFSVDSRLKNTMDVNLDITVNMPCASLSIDVRDAIGDRIHLSSGFTRDGTSFDTRQAHIMQSHGDALSVSEVVTSARRKSGGFLGAWRSAKKPSFKPTYNHVPHHSACRIYGSVEVKRVTGNLHITTHGHGYASHEHTDHKLMNLSHIITEFSFGPYFPDIAQPLDYSLEIAKESFTVFQYFLNVVPTVYHPARAKPLRTNQYSVTNYHRTIQHGRGTPGIFFRFDVDPIEMAVHQRTTSFLQFLVRISGIVGGVWVCASWGVKVASRAVVVVKGKDNDDGTILENTRPSKKSSIGNLGKRWAGGDIRARSVSNGWTIDGNGSPYSSYASTPTLAVNGFPHTPTTPGNGYLSSPTVGTPNPYGGHRSPASVPLPGTPGIAVGSPYPASPSPYTPTTPSSYAPLRHTTLPNVQTQAPTFPMVNGSGSPMAGPYTPVQRREPSSPYAPGGTNGSFGSPLPRNENGSPLPPRPGSSLNPANEKKVD